MHHSSPNQSRAAAIDDRFELGMAADIDRAIESLDFEQAHGMVHSLKGMAGNLAAVELQSAAIGLEKLVKLFIRASSMYQVRT